MDFEFSSTEKSPSATLPMASRSFLMGAKNDFDRNSVTKKPIRALIRTKSTSRGTCQTSGNHLPSKASIPDASKTDTMISTVTRTISRVRRLNRSFRFLASSKISLVFIAAPP